MKKCSKCNRELIGYGFAKKRFYCKPCHSVYTKDWYSRNLDKAKQIARNWKKRNPQRVGEYDKQWHIENKERRKSYPSTKKWKQYALKHYYGITVEGVNEMLERQKSKCAICLVGLSKDNLRVDHDHKTKKVRGILCNNCNLGIGNLKENKQYLISAIEYLKL